MRRRRTRKQTRYLFHFWYVLHNYILISSLSRCLVETSRKCLTLIVYETATNEKKREKIFIETTTRMLLRSTVFSISRSIGTRVPINSKHVAVYPTIRNFSDVPKVAVDEVCCTAVLSWIYLPLRSHCLYVFEII